MLKLLFSVVQKYGRKPDEPIHDSIPVASAAGPQRCSINHGAATATAAPDTGGLIGLLIDPVYTLSLFKYSYFRFETLIESNSLPKKRNAIPDTGTIDLRAAMR